MFADLLGFPFHLLTSALATPHPCIEQENVRSILIIRTAYIGDVVMTLPLLGPLKAMYPHAKLTFLAGAGSRPVLENNPHIDRIITYDPFWFYDTPVKAYIPFIHRLRQDRFDMVIEARGDIRDILFLVAPLKAKYKVGYTIGGGGYLLTHPVPYPGRIHRVVYHLNIARYLGWKGSKIDWGFRFTDQEVEQTRQLMGACKISLPYLAVHPGSRVRLKCLSSRTYARLYDDLMDRYKIPLVIMGGPGDTEQVSRIMEMMEHRPVCLAGRLSLRQMAFILSKAVLFICNDSAPMHIASMSDVPIISIFGPSKSVETRPYRNGCHVVEKPFPCRDKCDENHCSHPVHQACMKSVEIEDIFAAVKKIMGN